MKIGLIVNPIAGVGAKLAWKGTDDTPAAWKMIRDGYKAPIWEIVNRSLVTINEYDHEWFVGEGIKDKVNLLNKFNMVTAYEFRFESNAEDTVIAVNKLLKLKVDIIVFAGGDGTAVDIAKNCKNIPIIGIPGGVKIFSPCFLHRPEDLGNFLIHWKGETKIIELFDLDEEEYRLGHARPMLIGKAKIPIDTQIQGGKMSWNITEDDDVTFEGIVERIKEENMLRNKTVLIGPGGTMKNIRSEEHTSELQSH